jgi:hypothetical protein
MQSGSARFFFKLRDNSFFLTGTKIRAKGAFVKGWGKKVVSGLFL